LNKGDELVPMKVAGISIHRVLVPFFVIAAAVAMLMILAQEVVIPRLKDEIRMATSYGKSKAVIEPELIADNNNQLIFVPYYVPHLRKGRDVHVQRRHKDRTSTAELIRAQELVYRESEQGGFWVLLDGYSQRWDIDGRLIPNPNADGDPFTAHFEELRLETDMRPVDLESSDRDIPYLSWGELRDQYRRRPHLKHLEVKLHQRFAFPLANFILLLLGLPFVLREESKSVVVGVAAAIAIAGMYLLAGTICADLGNKGVIPPILAAWLPVLFFGALGLTLFDSIDS
ncbi:MAG: LptF/LptG family permease, partial [Planctomycetota bacterium]